MSNYRGLCKHAVYIPPEEWEDLGEVRSCNNKNSRFFDEEFQEELCNEDEVCENVCTHWEPVVVECEKHGAFEGVNFCPGCEDEIAYLILNE